MWAQIITLTVIVTATLGIPEVSPINRKVSNGVHSLGFKVIYGDEDLTVINQVVSVVEKNSALKKAVNLNEAIKPLPAQDVKCLMSVDRYCSKEMGAMKSVLIQAVKEDCEKCSIKQKEEAGKVIASMMAHDPVAWKLFLTRSALQFKPKKKIKKPEEFHFKVVGDPEDVLRPSQNRFTLPGFKVRVKRYATVAEKIKKKERKRKKKHLLDNRTYL